MRRVLIAVLPPFACSVLLAILAFGGGWTGFEGADAVTLAVALAAAVTGVVLLGAAAGPWLSGRLPKAAQGPQA